MTGIPETQRSTRTSRGALVTILTALMNAEEISGYTIADLAVATVTMPDGTRVNLSAHRIADDKMERLNKMGPRPRVGGAGSGRAWNG